jgi:SAM-dependent methyltransferase
MDQCETPLALNRWYAARAGLEIVTPRCDIFEYADKSGFDLICTHSFLSEFPPARRPALLARWRALLRPGGMAITVNRLRPAGGSAPYGFTAEQAVAFRSAVLANARSGPGWPDPADLARDTELYIARRYAYAVRSREEVAALFENAGFRIAELSCDPVKTGVRQEVTGPTTPGGAQYARIRAIAS